MDWGLREARSQQHRARWNYEESRTGSILLQISLKAIIKKPRSSMAELAEDLSLECGGISGMVQKLNSNL